MLTLGGIGLGMRVVAKTGVSISDAQVRSGYADRQTMTGNGISIQVTLLELGQGATATFDVALNTHWVDLCYDLNELATLREQWEDEG